MTTPPKPTTAALGADFEKQLAEIIAVKAMLARRDIDRRALLLTGTDAEVDKFDGDTLKLERRLARAEARQGAIREAHVVAAERELEERKAALRADAEEKRELAKAAYLRVEATLKDMFSDLEIIREADAAIANSNANLPAGAPELRPVEADFRWLNAEPDRVETVERRMPRPGYVAQVGEAIPERDRTEVETTTRVVPGRAAVRPDPLYDVLSAPALRPGDAPLRVAGTPLPMAGHHVKRLQPMPPLPEPAASAPGAPTAAAGSLNVKTPAMAG